ncbi:SH3 domain-containing protein [Geomonas ferrireducens]|uniref:SH3 domain-containing protein n=1 Tax=Geomonas ferrireducens TaxID=2570227 RepID=UPI0013A5D5FD|nr:SH3 domain-containing protein [Geomonas ferrireducens]
MSKWYESQWQSQVQKILEPQIRMQEQIEKCLGHQRLQEQVDRLLAPQLRVQKDIEKWLGYQQLEHQRLQEQVDRLLAPQLQVQKEIEKWQGYRLLERQRLQEQVDRLVESNLRLQEQVEKWLEPHRLLQKQVDKWLEPHRGVQEQIDKWLGFQHQLLTQTVKPSGYAQYVSELERLVGTILSEARPEGISELQPDAAYFDNGIVKPDELNLALADFFASQKSSVSLVTTLQNLQAYIKKLKKPLAAVIVLVVIPYIVNVVSTLTIPYLEEQWDRITKNQKKNKVKVAKLAPHEAFSQEVLNSYRFATSTLKVRKGPSIADSVVDEIHPGKVVRILQKRKSWTRIIYVSDLNDENITGYVFTRYLGKFKYKTN